MSMNRNENRLIREKSSYLQQHATNPVDWYPWSEEAFEKARAENKPVFLSIGYSTCHWCHVMARESFEDEEVAALLNEHFVSVKVDREERPDIDHLYMTVCQALTGHGGWPLTIVMTPDKKPFFAGTYFPKTRKFGRIGLMEILRTLHEKWTEEAEGIIETSEQIVQEVEKRMLSQLEGDLSADVLDKAFELYEQSFDAQYGGFGGAPKFPTSHNISFLLRYYQRTGNRKALVMAEKTLDMMSRGGIYDHIGYGFARYSVDEQWLVPHFEKMLYDNALLAWTHVEAYQVTGNRKYAEVAEQIFHYVLRDMTDPSGGFYSAEDADSEGEEGKFYVWTPEEVCKVLGSGDGELFCSLFDITEEGNFEGRSIPNLLAHDLDSFARLKGMEPEALRRFVGEARQKLFAHREQRVPPGKDDKVLTSWNGLMIMALAKGSKALGNRIWLEAAEKAARWIRGNMMREDGRLLARYRDGEAAIPAFVDDYAFYVWALLELYEATFRSEYLRWAIELNERMIDLFWDEEKGGLFFYGSDGEQLFSRNKEIYDGAQPSGNSVAALNFQRLAKLTYDARLSALADRQLAAFAGAVRQYPPGYSMMLIALEFAYYPGGEIVIAGDPESDGVQEMLAAARSGFRPNHLVVLVPPGSAGDEIRRLVPMTGDKTAIGGRPTAYICEHFACQSPTTDVEEMKQLLEG